MLESSFAPRYWSGGQLTMSAAGLALEASICPWNTAHALWSPLQPG